MASNFSFDVVSDFERQEMVNTVDQTRREIKNRYDLKDTKTTVELSDNEIVINADSEFTLNAVIDILRTKAAKRKLSQKIFVPGKIEAAGGDRVKQVITLQRGIPEDIAKKITKLIRSEFKKVQASIQGDVVRVSSKSKDDLQQVMQRLRQEEYPIELQFTNYRS
ncbi:MAG: YajQ family cyclic di-GMP-binding protein [Cyanobacteria bacterium J083]|nr:MAG: YajQ family cyclic di-GMP-binding protein [Cyanobacteria bacterium J083]